MYINKFIQILTSHLYFVNTIQQNHRAVSQFKERNYHGISIELKQIVELPHCRIYRDFIRSLITNKGIRTNGGSFLFYYIVLCSYANYRSSYRRTATMTYLVEPGEWICALADLRTWFRCRFQHQEVSILDYLH